MKVCGAWPGTASVQVKVQPPVQLLSLASRPGSGLGVAGNGLTTTGAGVTSVGGSTGGVALRACV